MWIYALFMVENQPEATLLPNLDTSGRFTVDADERHIFLSQQQRTV